MGTLPTKGESMKKYTTTITWHAAEHLSAEEVADMALEELLEPLSTELLCLNIETH